MTFTVSPIAVSSVSGPWPTEPTNARPLLTPMPIETHGASGQAVTGDLQQPLGSVDGVAGVLLAGVGRDEDADHLVANEFVDDRVEVDQHRERLVVEAAHQGSELGRAHAFGE